MESKTATTVVIFRKWRDGHVIALFPLITAEEGLIGCFEYATQHGSADYDYVISQTSPVSPTEYAALKRQLEDFPYGYHLEVRERRPSPSLTRKLSVKGYDSLYHRPKPHCLPPSKRKS
jgi:hypothetical protein